jgi:hypothetical protein
VPLHPLLWSAKLTSAKGLVGTYGVNTKHPRFSVTLHLNKPVSGFFFQIFFPWWTDIYVKIARPGYFCIVPFREKYNLISRFLSRNRPNSGFWIDSTIF